MKKISLSKSSFMEGLRCPRLWWLRVNRPELAAPPDLVTQNLFATGRCVGELAQTLFPGGIVIGDRTELSFTRLLADTRVAISSGAPAIFEGTFSCEGMHCRTDVLQRASGVKWHLGEVKMCTKVKPEHIDDVAFQCSCLEKAGHCIDRIYLIHVNNKYNRQGQIDPWQLFVSEEITVDVKERSLLVPAQVKSLLNLAENPELPPVLVGTHCTSPGKCPYYRICHENLPTVFNLPYGSKIIPMLIERGINMLEDIPHDIALSNRQAALVQSARTGKPVVNSASIKAFLRTFRYPIYYLDFETSNPCLPPWDDSSPYEKLPFQYSVHVQAEKGGALRHYEFLPETADDHRQQLCKKLIDVLGESGSIICWNASFEKSVLSGLAKRFPQYVDKIEAAINRIADLIIPFRSGSYADWRFDGSASLKKVLPVLAPDLSYNDMAIGKGDLASLTYQQYIEGQTTAEEWSKAREDLLAYCSLDTRAMAEIHKFLRSIQ